MYETSQKVNVDRLANAVVALDCINPSCLNVPKRERARISGQRWTAG